MKLYLTAQSSLELIRYLRSTNDYAGIGGTPLRKKTLRDAINTVRGVNELDNTAQLWLNHIEKPIHAFVQDRSFGTKTKGLVTHVLSRQAPSGTFIDLGHDVCICSPRFTFMQAASKVDLLDAILIGMELCGTYSKWRETPNDIGNPYFLARKETQSCTFDVPCAMRTSRAKAFVNRLNGWDGAVGARAALRWVLDGSASPMETAVYLQLCLPKRLGGYGLPKPVLNPKLIVNNPDGTKERYPDLFWAGANIDVEYNSDEEHSGEWSRYRDSKREIELTVANVKVLPLTRPQLMNSTEFDAFAQGLRRMLGIRSRGTDLEWVYRRNDLRRALLATWH